MTYTPYVKRDFKSLENGVMPLSTHQGAINFHFKRYQIARLPESHQSIEWPKSEAFTKVQLEQIIGNQAIEFPIDAGQDIYGFLIQHIGEDSNWLLGKFWQFENILCGFLANRDIDSDYKIAENQALRHCVWEAIPMEYERQAWIKHVMNKSDLSGYLGDTLADGLY